MTRQCPTPSYAPAQRGLWLALAVLILLLAAGLRLHRLGAQSLWNDEGASYAMTQRAPDAIIANAAADIHPPGYYLLLAGWTRLAGTSELALRFPSALASLLTVALVYALGRRLFGRGAGAAAALLLAANTFAIYYAQEARMYALLGLWATAGMAALAAWLERGGIRRAPLIALALINAAGLYTQYAYPLTMLAQGALFVLWWALRSRRWGPLLRYAAANVLTLALFAPWAGEAVRQVTTWPDGGAGAPVGALLATVTFGLAAGSPPWWAVFAALACAATGLWLNRARPLLALPALWAAVTLGAEPKGAATGVVGGVQVFVLLEGAIDVAAEQARLEKELAKLDKELAIVQRKLANSDFRAKAAAAVVAKEEEKDRELREKRILLDKALKKVRELAA